MIKSYEPSAEHARVLRLASIVLVALLCLVVAAGLVLTYRGSQEMMRSDAAFHRGEVRQAVVHARDAALAYVPGAAHVQAAHARLEAIARGAEAENRRDIAKFAWEALSVAYQRTDYPGRPVSALQKKAEAATRRLTQP